MGSHNIAGPGLARRRLGVIHIVFFTVAASAPLTVLAGGVTATYAITGVLGVPLSFILVGLSLAFFSVGYAAMSRFVANAGAFYTYIAKGLGRATGVSGAFVALLSYNAIQIALYGLFGWAVADFIKTKGGPDLAWWVWGFAAMALVAILGVLRVDLNASVLAVLLIFEVVAVTLFDIGALTHPASGSVTTTGWLPADLFAGTSFDKIGIVIALAVAAFTGFESAAIYSEECKDPRRTVGRATFIAVTFTSLFYALSSWALSVATGPDKVAEESGKPGIIFGLTQGYWGNVVADVANALFFTSMFAALLSFHNGIARYLFALGRERVLPSFLGRTGAGSGAPVAGSLLQTLLAAIVVGAFVFGGGDPFLQLFTWLSTLSAAGIVLLMAGSSAAVLGFFNSRPGDASVWQRLLAPVLAILSLLTMFGLIVWQFGNLIGATDTFAYLRWLLPGLIVAAAIVGLFWGLILRSVNRDAYDQIGRGALAPIVDDSQEYARTF
jgi:amino acid transporter